MHPENRCPITVVTGFLGSGKTTLLANILKHPAFKNTAVIINEYGQAGLDHRLIRRIEERTRLLSGGCICCNMRDDLINALKDLLFQAERGDFPLDRVVIETTGLAAVAPILFSLLMDPMLVHHFYVDLVICCLDAANGKLHLRENPEAVKQISAADTIIVTKTDIACPTAVTTLHRHLAQLNPAAAVMNAANGVIDPRRIFGSAAGMRNASAQTHMKQPLHMDAGHSASLHSMSLRFYKPLDWTAFGLWMSMLLYAHGENMLRVKGMVDVGDSGPVVINGVQHIIHPPQHLPDWNGEEISSQLVFIMKKITPAQILRSLKAFQHMLGAVPEIEEINLMPSV